MRIAEIEGRQLLSEVLGPFGREVNGLSNDLWYLWFLFFLFSVSEFLLSIVMASWYWFFTKISN